MKRTDITMKDVFISWTGKDRELKDIIVQHLNSNGISCLESDESCSGDYREWSKEAVGACSVFLLILTENTLKSKYVPTEIEEVKKLDDWENRVVPVCMNMELYQKHSWGLHESESAVVLGDQIPANEHLSAILHKTIDLLIHRQYTIYCNQSNKEYATLTPLLGSNKIAAKQYSYDSLYIPRSITELDDQGQYIETIESPSELIKNDDILFISGPAGSGKTQYIHQIRKCADNNDLVISLPCAKMAQSLEDLLSCIYHEFERIAGIRTFYSVDNFKRLLNVKHLVLILDGMDEIATQTGTKKFVNKVEKFYASNSKNVTLIFTSRNADDANTIALEGKKLRRFVLNKLTDSQVNKLSENLFLLFGSAEHNNEFYIKLNDLDEEIRANPLLLSQLALVYQNTGEIPQSVIGIYDAISKITFNIDLSTEFDSIPANYKEMLELELSSILKAFSQERYKLLSQGKSIEITKILSKILKEKYAGESKVRAEFLVEYLQNRSILVDGEFYHKMFLEYFTAVAYYEQAFDDYDEIENVNILNELFAHYDDAYWFAVIKLFLVKADSCIDESTTEELYDSILKNNEILEYTLLFDTCRDLIRHKEQAQLVLVCDILSKSVDGTYPPYGPLFWYVPEYALYETAVLAADKLLGNAKALALVRDVCFIFGQKYTVAEITDMVDGKKLYQVAKPYLSGVRDGLIELFCIGKTDCMLGIDIYPRCFNIAEVRHFMKYGYGMLGRMRTLFEDELGLWMEDYPELGGEYIGFISCPYVKDDMEQKLGKKQTIKVCGLALSNTENIVMDYVDFLRTSIKVMYIPENTAELNDTFDLFMPIELLVRMDYDIIYIPHDIRKLIIPEDIKFLCKDLFSHLSYLEEVYLSWGVQSIGYCAFQGCTALCSVTIPNSVNYIGFGAFKGCTALSDVIIPNSITRIESHMFYGCTGLCSINIPDSVTKIGCYSFFDCTNLSSINIPDSVTEIEFFAFTGCTNLHSITVPDSVTEIESNIFKGCAGLRSITIPDSVTKIGCSAFSDCTSLSSITIPNSVTHIEEEAFSGCIGLHSITIPDSVTHIDSSVFKDCINLSKIYIPSLPRFRTKFFHVNAEVICKKPIHVGSFERLASKLYIPDGTSKISDHEFAFFNFEKVHLPDTVTKIGEGAFEGCTSLSSITIPNSVTEIGRSAFKDCINLCSITIPDSVVYIGWNAFNGCTELHNVAIPDSVTKLENHMFEGCTGLGSISLPQSATDIGIGMFRGCTALSKIVIPKSVKYIWDGAFEDCTNLNSVIIPNSVWGMGKAVFQGCISLNRVVISNSMASIDDCTFKKCSNLREVTIPDSVKWIGDEAFSGCTNLSAITIHATVTDICREAFLNCFSLTELNIPKSVRHIGDDAFSGCTGLTSIMISANYKNDVYRIFGDIDTGIIVWVD